MAEVESFQLDHTAVRAPYVRLINRESGPAGDVISNFDLRFVQPNANAIPTGGCIRLSTSWRHSCVTAWTESLTAHRSVAVPGSI